MNSIAHSFRLSAAALLMAWSQAWGAAYQVDIDTSLLSGNTVRLAFDLIDGDGVVNNIVTITGFGGDGVLGGQSAVGGASGTLPGTLVLSDLDFFNEHLADITLGSHLLFVIDASAHAAGGLPDAFSFFMLDPSTNLPLFATTDATGADALFSIDLEGRVGGRLNVYSALDREVVVSVQPAGTASEPGSLALGLLAIAGLAACGRRPSPPRRTAWAAPLTRNAPTS